MPCFFSKLAPHEVAAVFAHVAADPLDADDARALRATCRLALRGYDCAVHPGWVPVSCHRADEPREEGATCEWVSGWFPVAMVRARLRLEREAVTVRVEHVLVGRSCNAVQWAAWRFPHGSVVLCETARGAGGGASIQDRAGFPHLFPVPVLFAAGLTALRVGHPSSATTLGQCLFPPTARDRLRRSMMLRGACSAVEGNASKATSLTSVDLSGLSSVTTVGDTFLSDATSLTFVDLSGLSSVTTVGDTFLSDATSLTFVDLSGLSSVTTVGEGFMRSATLLASVNLSSLANVTTVGRDFLSYGTSLTSLNLSGLSSVTAVGDAAFKDATSLTSVDLSGLSRLTTVGGWFMNGATSLTSADLSGLSSVTTVGICFFSFAPLLTSAQVRTCPPLLKALRASASVPEYILPQ